MVVLPQTPTQYRFFEGPCTEKWMKWSWCKLTDVCSLISTNYPWHKWGPIELLARFAYEPGVTDLPLFRKGLLLLRTSKANVPDPIGVVTYRVELHSTLEMEDQQLYAPAAWGREVLWAVHNQCTSFRVFQGRLIACNDDGGIYYLPAAA